MSASSVTSALSAALRVSLYILAGLVTLGLVLGLVSFVWTRVVRPVSHSREIVIDAEPEAVWAVLSDLPSWSEWSPNFRKASGNLVVGERLHNVLDSGGGELTFQPVLLAVDPGRELRWKGEFILPGVVDGEHYFLLDPLPGGRTRFVQGEDFVGALVLYAGSAIDVGDGMAAFNAALADEVRRRASVSAG